TLDCASQNRAFWRVASVLFLSREIVASAFIAFSAWTWLSAKLMESESSILDDESCTRASTMESLSPAAWLIQKIASLRALAFGEFLAISRSIGNACADALVA